MSGLLLGIYLLIIIIIIIIGVNFRALELLLLKKILFYC